MREDSSALYMVFQPVSWKVEPAEGKFAFEAWEKKAWDHVGQDKHVVLQCMWGRASGAGG